MNDAHTTVSPSAAARAEAMLPGLQRELARSARKRRVRRRVVGVCTLVMIVGGSILAAAYSRSPAPPTPGGAVAVAEATAAPWSGSGIEVVRTMEAPMIERVDTVKPVEVAVSHETTVDYASISVNDREMLDLLNEMGRPSGLVRANGRVWLTAAVTDEEIAAQKGSPRGF
ncbi:MAG: hypothetical protein ACTS27_07595 [Phycisphaerales bacterium]